MGGLSLLDALELPISVLADMQPERANLAGASSVSLVIASIVLFKSASRELALPTP